MSKQPGLNRTAEAIGAGLGHVQAKYDAWMRQRYEIAGELEGYMAQAKQMLAALGHTADVAVADVKVAVATGDAGRKRVISAAHKEAISRAAKARWAARRGLTAQKVEAPAPARTRQVSAEVRARLSQLAKLRWKKAKKAGQTRLGG